MEKLGALAAFGTALCWSLSAIFFENSSRKVGALAVNFWKVVFAFALLSLAGLVDRGMPLPLDASARTWLFLSLSGVIGFIISDHFLFNAYVLIGSRTTVVFQAITPLFTALFAFIFLHERMRTESLIGMFIVVCGILIVVLSKHSTPGYAGANKEGALLPKIPLKGYLFAFLSSLFQAGGLILSKTGLGDYNAISGTQIRVFTGIVGFGLQALLTGQMVAVFKQAPSQKQAMRSTAYGSVFGPFIGVTLSLFALQNAEAGTASTLMALTPVLIIAPSIFILKQKIKPLEAVGAAVATLGAALFFLL